MRPPHRVAMRVSASIPAAYRSAAKPRSGSVVRENDDPPSRVPTGTRRRRRQPTHHPAPPPRPLVAPFARTAIRPAPSRVAMRVSASIPRRSRERRHIPIPPSAISGRRHPPSLRRSAAGLFEASAPWRKPSVVPPLRKRPALAVLAPPRTAAQRSRVPSRGDARERIDPPPFSRAPTQHSLPAPPFRLTAPPRGQPWRLCRCSTPPQIASRPTAPARR